MWRGERLEHYETIRQADGSIVEISLTISPVRNPEGDQKSRRRIHRRFDERHQRAQVG
jgi:hypothetical protein